MEIKCGADPEAFLVDTSGHFKSSIGKIGGSKEMPRPLPLGQGYAVQEDNVALEFNIPAAESRSQFVDSISRTLKYLTDMVQRNYGYEISHVSAISFPEEELQDPSAMEFGCTPDFNAWTKEINPKPKAEDWKLRSCGGHVHIGFDVAQVDRIEVIKFMDLFTGVPSVLMDNGDLRKELYGKSGAFRDTSYGVEYRTLSNFWIFKDPLIEWIWNNTSRAVEAAAARLPIGDDDAQDIISCINNNDKALAQKLVDKFNLEVVYV